MLPFFVIYANQKIKVIINKTSVLSVYIVICKVIYIIFTAQAFPCNGNNGEEYCTGYHDGAIQAHRDFKTGDDLDVDQHRCTGSEEYCTGYNTGYSDEEDFLG